MIVDEAAKTLRFRQSWLDTALLCAERGRLDFVAPVREEGDAAFAGTSMHKAVEQFLAGNLTIDHMEQYAQQYAANGAAHGIVQDDLSIVGISYKSFDGPNELIYHAGNCTRGWIQDILPVLIERGELTGSQEVKFEFEAFNYRGYTVILQGTVDHVPDYGTRMYDWKSSSSDYRQKEKQMYAVQPTVYTAAAIAGCFGREFNWPVQFAYGVAIRLKTKARGQIVECQRNQGHIDWLYRRIRTFIDLYISRDTITEWPTTEDNWLCSEKWCPWYAECRGKHIERSSDLFGYTPS